MRKKKGEQWQTAYIKELKETKKKKRSTERTGSTSGDTVIMEKMAHLLY